MKTAILTRGPSTQDGTFGILITDSGFMCHTGELPWRNNQTGISCIPPGTYVCRWRLSPTKGMCYHVDSVPGRTDVEIHAANFMGDKSLGKRCELLGCIAPGLEVGELDGQMAVTFSKDALVALVRDLAQENFTLTIVGA